MNFILEDFMLGLISLGLYDMHDMSFKAIKLARKCDVLYLESYTNFLAYTVEDLERFLGKKIVILERVGIENESSKLVNEAKEKNVGILVGGDCLSATTHISLLLECEKNGVNTQIIHGSSIFSSIAETGLFIYNFGKVGSIPFDFRNLKSPIEVLEGNQKLGLHSLFLFDLNPKEMRFLDSKPVLKYFVDQGFGDLDCVVCGAIGGKAKFKFGKINDLVNYSVMVYPQCLVVLGKLHFIEEEALERFK